MMPVDEASEIPRLPLDSSQPKVEINNQDGAEFSAGNATSPPPC